jgi:phenylacetate-coenzyme A ligase PaaK-like adenylate-forming protein
MSITMSDSNTLPPATGDFEVDRQRHVHAYRERQSGEVARLTWPLDRLQALRDQRLRALVRIAKERSPWHAARLSHIDPATLSGDDLSAIPPMTKADLMEHWDEIVTDRRLTLGLASRHLERVAQYGPAYLLDQYTVIASGGSSGLRGIFVWDFDGWLVSRLVMYRHDAWVTQRLAPTGIGRDAVVVAPNPVHASAAISGTFGNTAGSMRAFPATLPLAEIVAGLNDYQPDVIRSYPSVFHLLALEAQAGRLRVAPRYLYSAAEPLSAAVRRTIEDAFGVPIVDNYVCSENSHVAASFPGRPALHLVEDVAVYEPVDAAGRPVAPGRPAAKLLLTNVVNQILPLIRYELTDGITFLAEPNPGPWTGRRIAPVRGRLEQVFHYHGGVIVNPEVFDAALDAEPAIAEAQVRQTERGTAITVRTIGAVDLGPVRGMLETTLQRLGLADPEVTITPVAHLERTAGGGKLQRFIPLQRP